MTRTERISIKVNLTEDIAFYLRVNCHVHPRRGVLARVENEREILVDKRGGVVY